ncbi:MAG: hypothetical protein ACPG7U_00625 [Holosporaceae bacterium]
MFFKQFYCLFFFSLCLLASLMLQAMMPPKEDDSGVQNGVPLMQRPSVLPLSDGAPQADDASIDSVAGRASTDHTLCLPNEILQRILVLASVELPSDKVVSAPSSDWKVQGFFKVGAKRHKDALKMRLVCRRFYGCMVDTQCTSLDTFVVPSPSQFPYGRHTFDDLQNFSVIQYLDLSNASVLPSLQGLENCRDLKFLNLRHCSTLQTLEGLENCLQLYDLNLHGCRQLSSLKGLPPAATLKHLNLYGCDDLGILEGVEDCLALEDINLPGNELLDLQVLQSCRKLKRVAYFGMPSNRLLILEQCNALERLLCRDKKNFREVSAPLMQVLEAFKRKKVMTYQRKTRFNERLTILNQHYSKGWRPLEADQAWNTFFLDSETFVLRQQTGHENE